MPTATRKARRPAPDPVPCSQCPTEHRTETDLVIHLVEEHDALWTSTNSFGLDDLMIPAPPHTYEDEPAEDASSSWVRKLIRRTA